MTTTTDYHLQQMVDAFLADERPVEEAAWALAKTVYEYARASQDARLTHIQELLGDTLTKEDIESLVALKASRRQANATRRQWWKV